MTLTTFATLYVDATLLAAAAIPVLILAEAIRRTYFISPLDSFNSCEINPAEQEQELLEVAVLAQAEIEPQIVEPMGCNACLSDRTSRELKQLAKLAKIKNYGSMPKASLIRQLDAAYCLCYAL